ncbi:MAG: glycosyltransferase family 2 protein [Cellulophaga sp.]|nr:glycosyltransferase family 2 protein [Cellulophaga sp.]
MHRKIAVLITCFNRKEKSVHCLKQLFSNVPQNIELKVFLVDDGSTDGTSEAISSEFPQVRIIQGTGSLYWNRGMHLAWKTATDEGSFDYFMLLNDDTFLNDDALEELLYCADATQNKAVISAAFCSATTGEFSYGAKDNKGKSVIPNGQVTTCFYINGNCMLIPNAVYQKVGILDPIYPHAIGDFDYGHRAMAKGFNLVTTRNYIGTCEPNEKLPTWCYGDIPFKKRVASLYSPLGNSHPKYYFVYTKRHFGIKKAVWHYFTIHLRLLIPGLWKT